MTLDHRPPEGHGPAPAIGVDLEERRPRCQQKKVVPLIPIGFDGDFCVCLPHIYMVDYLW